MLSGKEDIPQIIERLKEEKRGWLESARSEGESDGGNWAAKAHYSELVLALAQIGSLKSSEDTRGSVPAAEDLCLDYWEKGWKMKDTNSPEQDEARRVYREGWRAGVLGLWELVRNQLED